MREGDTMATETSRSYGELMEGVTKAEAALREMSTASQEQSKGTTQIAGLLPEMKKLNQTYGRHATRSACAVVDMERQITDLLAMLADVTAADSSNGKGREAASKRTAPVLLDLHGGRRDALPPAGVTGRARAPHVR